jgi:hypothetical protein
MISPRPAPGGARTPRLSLVPEFDSSAGVEAIELAARAGLVLDPWERDVLTAALGEVDGRWAAFRVGLVVPRQNGKGPHALETPILTTDGWTTFADIKADQFVYGADGFPTRVVAVSDVYPDELCYEVTFTDGSRYVVGSGHLWRVKASGEQRWQVLDTGTLARSVGKRRTDNGRMEYRWRVRCDAVPKTPDVDLPIDPYVFGLWLGDGGHVSSTLTVGDEDLAFIRDELVTAGYEVRGETVGNIEYRPWHVTFGLGARWSRGGVIPRLRELGVYGNKHIPEVYLTASRDQRIALLRGLMDTDGSIGNPNRSPQVEFSTSNDALARDFQRLARSLGIRVRPIRRATKKRDNWRFLWTPSFNPFRMPRKARRFTQPASRRHELMSIVAIRPVPSVPTRCIQVEANDGVYLVGHHFTPTHNSVLEARELAGLFLFGERLIIHSAHEQATSSEHFLRLVQLIESAPDFSGRILKVSRGKGAEAIHVRGFDGGVTRIFFKTRTTGGGRGLTGDLVVLDEAMILPGSTMSALVPTMAARSIHGNPQLWLTGSAVDKERHEHGLELARVRVDALRGAERLCYLEWSAATDVEDPDLLPPELLKSPDAWAQANPGLGIRISAEHVAGELDALGQRGFAVERLGVGDWPDPSGDADREIRLDEWRALQDPESQPAGMLFMAFDVRPDRGAAAIGVAARREDDLFHVEVIDHRAGTGWVVERLVDLVRAHGPHMVVLDESSPAASLLPRVLARLAEEGLDETEVVPLGAREHAAACGVLVDAVRQQQVRHLGSQELVAAIRGAGKRPLGDSWAWGRLKSDADICPLVAVTLALGTLEATDVPEPFVLFGGGS